MRRLGLAAVVGVLVGFGGGYIANDQLGKGDRKVTVQHKRDPNVGAPTRGSLTGRGVCPTCNRALA